MTELKVKNSFQDGNTVYYLMNDLTIRVFSVLFNGVSYDETLSVGSGKWLQLANEAKTLGLKWL